MAVGATTRAARAGDEPAIAEIRVLGWQTAYRGVVADAHLDAMSVEADATRWSSLIATQDELHRTLVVEADGDGRVVGFCSLGPYRTVDLHEGLEVVAVADPGSTGEVYAFYVHPDDWGTGVADVLMVAALDALARDGWQRGQLWQLAENPRARRFYERHGWVVDGAEQVLPLPGEPHEIRLSRRLR